MPKVSAGLLMYCLRDGRPEVLLAHPGGPLYTHRDDGSWTIPKGEVDPGEDLLKAAQREFREETGFAVDGPFWPLPVIKQKSGKVIHAWAFAGNCNPEALVSNPFEMEWPPRSGQKQQFPEIDRAEFFDFDTARRKLNAAQAQLVDALEALLTRNDDSPPGD